MEFSVYSNLDISLRNWHRYGIVGCQELQMLAIFKPAPHGCIGLFLNFSVVQLFEILFLKK
jgi:hypothetical protein